jgi:hypothetical protein
MKKIAQALWYHRSGHRLRLDPARLCVFTPSLMNRRLGSAPHAGICKALDRSIDYLPAETPHPEIFSYDFFASKEPPAVAFRFWFYRGVGTAPGVRYDVSSERLARRYVREAFWSVSKRQRTTAKRQARLSMLRGQRRRLL